MFSLQAALLAMAVGGGPEVVLLDFNATWCGPCRQMEGTLGALERAGYRIERVDIDRQRELAARYRVDRVPTFVLTVDGQEVERVVGPASFDELRGLLDSASKRGGPAGVVRGQSPDGAAGGQQAGGEGFPAQRFPVNEGQAPLERLSPSPDHWRQRGGDGGGAGGADGAGVQGTGEEAAGDGIDPKLAARLLQASVRVKIDDGGSHSVGSGTIIDSREGEALVLTCGHLFRDSKGEGPVRIDLFGPDAPTDLPGKLISYDLTSDVGLVSFRPPVPVAAARVAPAAYTVRQNDTVVNIGCNHGQEPTSRVSRVTAIDKFLGPSNLVVAGQPVQGRSGGGLFTGEGLVIGVCNAADPADDEGLYAALPSIHAELERMGLSALCQEPAPPAEATLLAAEPPSMPQRMPGPADQRFAEALVPTSADGAPDDLLHGVGDLVRGAGDSLRTSDALPGAAAALEAAAAAAGRHQEAEVICIVRPREPGAKSEIFVLDEASAEFLKHLTGQRRELRRFMPGSTNMATRHNNAVGIAKNP